VENMPGRVEILGSGAAEMTPAFNCHCEACEEARREHRLRRRCACVLVELDGSRLLIDVGSPEAVVEAGEKEVKTLLLSHEHVDHLAGLNLLKWSSTKVNVYCSNHVLNSYYVWPFAAKNRDVVEFNTVEAFKTFKVPVAITPIPLNHSVPTLGFIIENAVAYLLDTVNLPEDSLKRLREAKVQVMLVDATYGLREDYVNHNNLSLALELVRKTEPTIAVLTHIAHYAGRFKELERAVEELSWVKIALDHSTFTLT